MEDDFGPDHGLTDEISIVPKAYDPDGSGSVARGGRGAAHWRAMWRRHRRSMVALCVLGVLAAACARQTTRADTIAKWDAICRTTQARLVKVPVPTVSSGVDLKPFASATQRALPIVIQELDQLGAVPVPPDDQKTADRILTDLERAVDQLHRAERSARQGNLAATQSEIARSQTYTATAIALARSYGFRVCGRSPGAGTG